MAGADVPAWADAAAAGPAAVTTVADRRAERAARAMMRPTPVLLGVLLAARGVHMGRSLAVYQGFGKVEDALTEEFSADGEITGAGALLGVARCHLDLEVEPDVDSDAALKRIWGVLAALGVDDHAKINISE
jgi:hypothetical protein